MRLRLKAKIKKPCACGSGSTDRPAATADDHAGIRRCAGTGDQLQPTVVYESMPDEHAGQSSLTRVSKIDLTG